MEKTPNSNDSRGRREPHVDIHLQNESSTRKATKSPLIKKKEHINPFGSAKPREEVLAKKGIDFHVIDERIQKKADVSHFTRTQEFHLKTFQDDLLKAEQKLREANEKELPEEELRFVVEQKRKAFNDLMKRFKEENDDIGNKRFERPSERRRRRRYDHNRNHPLPEPMGGRYYDEDPFASFHRRNKGSSHG
eukprot:CAMPEP_0203633238 /NCGR_PEP_ID=MMETSP0088-20131115/371_1 /ASSEMBLY_ACC=CAM_ASM_001087 /TAXON_ID=426623 /ORGANISM="Chaetoceros affinis, Strain CCMP159" /LENGTH=191 /DNA_ID=CAMNT_0050486491 /DNA_START=115 /DNA_END=690 /DNA_ORIENTATION=-